MIAQCNQHNFMHSLNWENRAPLLQFKASFVALPVALLFCCLAYYFTSAPSHDSNMRLQDRGGLAKNGYLLPSQALYNVDQCKWNVITKQMIT